MKIFVVITTSLLLAGCYNAYHNFNEKGSSSHGGGFMDKRVDEGLYRIIAKANTGPFANYSAAHKVFDRRAAELCAPAGFEPFGLRENHYPHTTPRIIPGVPPPLIVQVIGYVVCRNGPLTVEQARAQIETARR